MSGRAGIWTGLIQAVGQKAAQGDPHAIELLRKMTASQTASGGYSNFANDYLHNAGVTDMPYVDEGRKQAGAFGQMVKGAAPIWGTAILGAGALGAGGAGAGTAASAGSDLAPAELSLGGGAAPAAAAGGGGFLHSLAGYGKDALAKLGGGNPLLGGAQAGLGLLAAHEASQQRHALEAAANYRNSLLTRGLTQAEGAYASKAPLREGGMAAIGRYLANPRGAFQMPGDTTYPRAA